MIFILHLGFRQFQRVTPSGINQREADVAGSFARAIDKVIALAPDLVLIAGDVFHTVRPTNPAILHAFHQFSRLRQELPGLEITTAYRLGWSNLSNGALLQAAEYAGIAVLISPASSIKRVSWPNSRAFQVR